MTIQSYFTLGTSSIDYMSFLLLVILFNYLNTLVGDTISADYSEKGEFFLDDVVAALISSRLI